MLKHSALAALLAATPAAAATTNYLENANTLKKLAAEGEIDFLPEASEANTTNRDWKKNPDLVTLDIFGDSAVYGYLANIRPTQFGDGFTARLGTGRYLASFSIMAVRDDPDDDSDNEIDGSITFAGDEKINWEGDTSFDLGEVSGDLTVSLLLSDGDAPKGEEIVYDLQLVQIPDVPLPAGALLLLGGLGALFVARRRNS